MSVKINKNGNEYDLGFMPEHYPADRVYLHGNTNEDAESAIDGKASKSGDTFSGHVTIDRANGTTEGVGTSNLILGNNVPSGTAGNSRGQIALYGTSQYYARLRADALTANRDITMPDRAGKVQVASDISNLEDILKYHTGITPTSSGKSTLLAYINDIVIPKKSFIYGFGAESFSDLPSNDWGYDVVVFRLGSTFVLASRQQSDGVIYVRNINANSQWAGNSWKQL